MRLKLVAKDTPALNEAAAHVATYDIDSQTYHQLSYDMFALMLKQGGIGLAAPQVGFPIRMFVMGDENTNFVCINPIIIGYSEDDVVTDTEGCLTFPGVLLDIERYDKIHTTFFDVDGKLIHQEFTGIWARCFQHEMEHLDGVLFTSKVSKIKLQLANKKAKKLSRRKKRG